MQWSGRERVLRSPAVGAVNAHVPRRDDDEEARISFRNDPCGKWPATHQMTLGVQSPLLTPPCKNCFQQLGFIIRSLMDFSTLTLPTRLEKSCNQRCPCRARDPPEHALPDRFVARRTQFRIQYTDFKPWNAPARGRPPPGCTRIPTVRQSRDRRDRLRNSSDPCIIRRMPNTCRNERPIPRTLLSAGLEWDRPASAGSPLN